VGKIIATCYREGRDRGEQSTKEVPSYEFTKNNCFYANKEDVQDLKMKDKTLGVWDWCTLKMSPWIVQPTQNQRPFVNRSDSPFFSGLM
jgi:hypothetical protein